ncbi:MAG: nucleoside transporter, partial [Kordiimonadaceae bacterium]|nr:nucleoside transporter [Kordiimonadaceae bacterium]
MFIGHFAAWLAAGIMGAGAAMLIGKALTSLDAGEVAYQALGAAGILAVIIAGWTTSNPTIYRAGLAFQSLNPKWSREKVTLVVGVLTTIIACFPFVFTGLLNYLGIMALVLAPTGGIIVAEHFIFKKMNLVRYWRAVKGDTLNVPAAITWAVSVGVAAILSFGYDVHVLFLFVPAWVTAFVLYPILAKMAGAGDVDRDKADQMAHSENNRKMNEIAYLQTSNDVQKPKVTIITKVLRAIVVLSLIAGFVVGFNAYSSGDLAGFKTDIAVTTIVYFIAALALVFMIPKKAD